MGIYQFKCEFISVLVPNSNNKVLSYRKARNFKEYQSLLKSCDIGLSTVLIKKKILWKRVSKNCLFIGWIK